MTNRGEKISICLCTYNGERFLGEQLDSILNQTVLPDEIVIVDDASKDGTYPLLLNYQKNHPTLFKIYQNQVNLGYRKNFAKVLSLSEGDLLFFADQDDVWDSQKLARFVAVFDKNTNCTSVCCLLDLIDENDKPLGLSSFNKGIKRLSSSRRQWKSFLHHPLIPGTGMAIRRSLMKRYSPIPEGFLHDEWFSLCSSFDNGIALVPDVLVHYRQHSEQAIGDHSKTFAEKANAIADFERVNKQYLVLCSSDSYAIDSLVSHSFQKRSLFFSFRGRQRQKSFFRSWGSLIINPGYFRDYFVFCDRPFSSMGKDLFFQKKP